jgi:S-adenosylmethionine synthetase
MSEKRLFTSEAITMGHPDKVADQISDAILDELLKQDPNSRVACETLVKTGLIIVAGEITTTGYCDFPIVARRTIEEIGYTDTSVPFNHKSVGVLSAIEPQSPDIALGVDKETSQSKDVGAGDQGLMFGYACNETEELMPAPMAIARRMVNLAAEVRQNGTLPYLRPDGKGQVTIEYDENWVPVRVDTMVFSNQHTPEVSQEQIREDIIKYVVNPSIPENLMNDDIIYHINPTGNFVEGGPQADAGLTGRKIIVDTYGGMGRHGGGAFSGKDATKVDRSAAYGARYAAKNVVAAGLADRCEIQLAYAIGVAEPVSIFVDTFGTGKIADTEISKLLRDHFTFTPAGMIEHLKLTRPVFLQTARYGHFGVSGDGYTWEMTDKADALKSAAGSLATA